MDQSHHIDSSTPLEPLPEEHWRGLMREQAERNVSVYAQNGAMSRLTADDIADIVWHYRQEPRIPMRAIAADYGITASYAGRIGRGHVAKRLAR